MQLCCACGGGNRPLYQYIGADTKGRLLLQSVFFFPPNLAKPQIAHKTRADKNAGAPSPNGLL